MARRTAMRIRSCTEMVTARIWRTHVCTGTAVSATATTHRKRLNIVYRHHCCASRTCAFLLLSCFCVQRIALAAVLQHNDNDTISSTVKMLYDSSKALHQKSQDGPVDSSSHRSIINSGVLSRRGEIENQSAVGAMAARHFPPSPTKVLPIFPESQVRHSTKTSNASARETKMSGETSTASSTFGGVARLQQDTLQPIESHRFSFSVASPAHKLAGPTAAIPAFVSPRGNDAVPKAVAAEAATAAPAAHTKIEYSLPLAGNIPSFTRKNPMADRISVMLLQQNAAATPESAYSTAALTQPPAGAPVAPAPALFVPSASVPLTETPLSAADVAALTKQAALSPFAESASGSAPGIPPAPVVLPAAAGSTEAAVSVPFPLTTPTKFSAPDSAAFSTNAATLPQATGTAEATVPQLEDQRAAAMAVPPLVFTSATTAQGEGNLESSAVYLANTDANTAVRGEFPLSSTAGSAARTLESGPAAQVIVPWPQQQPEEGRVILSLPTGAPPEQSVTYSPPIKNFTMNATALPLYSQAQVPQQQISVRRSPNELQQQQQHLQQDMRQLEPLPGQVPMKEDVWHTEGQVVTQGGNSGIRHAAQLVVQSATTDDKTSKLCFTSCDCWPVWALALVAFVGCMIATSVVMFMTAGLFSKGLWSVSFYKGGGYWILAAAVGGTAVGSLIGGLAARCIAAALGLAGGLMALSTSLVILGWRGALLGAIGGVLTGGVVGAMTGQGGLAITLGAGIGIMLGTIAGFAPFAPHLKINERYIRRGMASAAAAHTSPALPRSVSKRTASFRTADTMTYGRRGLGIDRDGSSADDFRTLSTQLLNSSTLNRMRTSGINWRSNVPTLASKRRPSVSLFSSQNTTVGSQGDADAASLISVPSAVHVRSPVHHHDAASSDGSATAGATHVATAPASGRLPERNELADDHATLSNK